jgi:hypothetical protein
MSKYKYIVCDEDGPIRVFHDKQEANKFLQDDWWVEVVKIPKKVYKFEDAPF